MTTSKKRISKVKRDTNPYHTPIGHKNVSSVPRRRTIPESVCSKIELETMESIHQALWEQGWKLRTIGKRKFGWYFYIIPRETYEQQASKAMLKRDTDKAYRLKHAS
jgi:hypothetical protein